MIFYKTTEEITPTVVSKLNYQNKKIGVIAYIENKQGEILLQRRGIKSRDEKGLFECIGGEIDAKDSNYKQSIIREISEEAGNSLNLIINNPLGIYCCQKNAVNWVFIIFYVKYINGDFKIVEPQKCTGYKFFSYNAAMQSKLVAESCKVLIKSLKENS